MDGLLINSEDMITSSINKLLEKYGRPAISRDIRVQLMGVPDSSSSDIFHDWAKVPIARKDFDRELNEEMKRQFIDCEPLPGAEKLLANLSRARSSSSGNSILLALASTTKTDTYELKTSKPDTKSLLNSFAASRRILGDDPRVGKGRGKPAPDIYLVALEALKETTGQDIRPDECLVFEDSVVGVEAGRRAGMRVVWVPHPDVAAEWELGQKDVLAGRTGTSGLGEEWQLGEIDDGWAESIPTLEHFDYEKYHIHVPT